MESLVPRMAVLLRIEDLTQQTPDRELRFTERLVTIGRDGSNVLQLSDPDQMISRRHAALRCGPTPELMDLGSRNATYLNGRRLEPQKAYPVHSGDVIRLGPFRVEFHQPPVEPPRSTEPDTVEAEAPSVDLFATRYLSRSDAKRYQLPDRSASREELYRAVEELHLLNELALEIGASLDAETIMQRVVRRGIEVLEAEQGLITLLSTTGSDGRPGAMRTMIRIGQEFHLNEHIHAWMLDQNRPLLLNDPRRNPAFRHVQWNEALRNLISVPLLVRGELRGLLTIYNKKDEEDFTSSDLRLLSIIASQSAQIIENARLFEEQKKLLRVQHEMQVALEIQVNLLPPKPPVIEGYDVAGVSVAAQTVGGDHFDYIPMPDERWALCVGDVSGKGLPAALVMANLQATLRAQTQWSDSVKSCLEGANRLLYESTNRRTFVTLFYGVLEPYSHRFQYANAGHNPPLRYHDGRVEELPRGGFVLAGMRSVRYTEQALTFAPGDVLLIYSDGVVEARNAAGDLFGEERLREVLYEHRAASAQRLIDAVMAAVQAHADGTPQADDITMVAVRRGS